LLANSLVKSDVDPDFFLRFKDIRVLQPQTDDFQQGIINALSPQECRLRDVTYAGTITVDIEFTRGKQIVSKRNIDIARMPIMLRSCVYLILIAKRFVF
jgi:DNA-directed RNA polymerase III subunit RPC2